MHDLHYILQFEQRSKHIVDVCLRMAKPDLQGQILWLPNWIPGSYMIRDFCRQVVSIQPWVDGQPWYIEKLGKNRWRCAPTLGPMEVRYQVYGMEASVRALHVDLSHAYFNGAALLLAVEGQENKVHVLELCPFAASPLTPPRDLWLPPLAVSGEAECSEAADVAVATSMPVLSVDARGFGLYQAESYADLIDHPCEIGQFQRLDFRVGTTPHQIVLRHAGEFDRVRLCNDLQRICAAQIEFFGGVAPFSHYLFIVQVQEHGYGGLEHAASSSLLTGRDSLPQRWDPAEPGDAYTQFLGLLSHEYFHAWNVKRLRPKACAPLALEHEVHTTLLWFFEGVTSYYDDCFLYRAGVITEEHYLRLLGQQISRYLRQPGWRYQSLADSSFDAWTKYYRQDENSINVQTSYYIHGSLLAMCLDLYLRQRIKRHRSSLDAVMQTLWARRDQYAEGLTYEDILNQLRTLSHREVAGFLEPLLFDHLELPLQPLLHEQGITLNYRVRESRQDAGGTAAASQRLPEISLGGQWQFKESGMQLTQVFYNGTLAQAGLAPGDLLVAVAGRRPTEEWLNHLLRSAAVGTALQVHVFQQEQLQVRTLILQAAPLDTCYLTLREGKKALTAAHSWLAGKRVVEETGKDREDEPED